MYCWVFWSTKFTSANCIWKKKLEVELNLILHFVLVNMIIPSSLLCIGKVSLLVFIYFILFMSNMQALQLGQEVSSPSGFFGGQRCQMCLRSDSLHKVMERLANPGNFSLHFYLITPKKGFLLLFLVSCLTFANWSSNGNLNILQDAFCEALHYSFFLFLGYNFSPFWALLWHYIRGEEACNCGGWKQACRGHCFTKWCVQVLVGLEWIICNTRRQKVPRWLRKMVISTTPLGFLASLIGLVLIYS